MVLRTFRLYLQFWSKRMQIIDIALLLQRQLIPCRDLVTHDPQVGELVHQVLELLLGLGLLDGFVLLRCAAHKGGSHSNANHQFFHYLCFRIGKPTLATFLSWGISEGAGRIRLTRCKSTDFSWIGKKKPQKFIRGRSSSRRSSACRGRISAGRWLSPRSPKY